MSGTPIIPPRELPTDRAELNIFVMNPIYRDEIAGMLSSPSPRLIPAA